MLVVNLFLLFLLKLAENREKERKDGIINIYFQSAEVFY